MNQRPNGSFLSAETLAAIIDIFVEDAPRQIESIQAAMEHSDHQTVEKISHKLRGSTEFLGTSGISSLAAAVEEAAILGDTQRLKSVVPGLTAEVQLLLDQLVAAESEPDA